MSAADTRPTVIVPSLAAARVGALLRSLAGQSVPLRAVVIDNGSPGAEVTRACGPFAFAEAIRSEENLGFSRAVNRGAREARGDAIVVLNDDAVYDPEFVERIVAGLDPDAGVMMAAGVLRDDADEGRIDTAGIVIDATLLAFDHLNGEPLEALADAPEPLGPSGGAASYARAAWERVGGFDESIFAYFEDVDLALRMREQGWSCRLVADAQGTHHHSATLGSGSPEKNYLMGFARGYLLRKWRVMRPRRAAAILARDMMIAGGQGVIDRNLAGIRGRIAGWRAGLDSRRDYPQAVVDEAFRLSLAESLHRRVARRARLRSGG